MTTEALRKALEKIVSVCAHTLDDTDDALDVIHLLASNALAAAPVEAKAFVDARDEQHFRGDGIEYIRRRAAKHEIAYANPKQAAYLRSLADDLERRLSQPGEALREAFVAGADRFYPTAPTPKSIIEQARVEAERRYPRGAEPEAWISVKDRLPDYAVPVQVYCHDYPIPFTATYEMSERKKMQWWSVPNYGYSKKVEWEVTHWRRLPPLPEPPRHPAPAEEPDNLDDFEDEAGRHPYRKPPPEPAPEPKETFVCRCGWKGTESDLYPWSGKAQRWHSLPGGNLCGPVSPEDQGEEK